MNLEFVVKIYGKSSNTGGYKFEVINIETSEIEFESVANTQEEARIKANRFLDEYITQPIEVFYRSLAVN